MWNFDGSSTGQSLGSKSDLFLKPVATYLDPLLGEPNRLVLCETYGKDRKPTGIFYLRQFRTSSILLTFKKNLIPGYWKFNFKTDILFKL